jgi:hypothetical protein
MTATIRERPFKNKPWLRPGEAEPAADQAGEPADDSGVPCVGAAAAPIRSAATAVPGRPGSAIGVRPQPRRTEDGWLRTEDMQITMHHASTAAVWAYALFASVLQRSDTPDAGQVQQAIAAAVRDYGDQGCAQRVAREFGDHPETAVARMHWARAVASATPGSPPEESRRTRHERKRDKISISLRGVGKSLAARLTVLLVLGWVGSFTGGTPGR